MDAISQGVAIAKGEQESFNWGELAGATVEGAVVGAVASTGVGAGLAGAMLAGGVGAAAGNVTTQLINTGSVDGGQLALATGAGVLGGAAGYGIGKAISKVSSKVMPKIANKIDDFVTKRRVAKTGGSSTNTASPKKNMLKMDLQFFAKESGGCPYEGGAEKVGRNGAFRAAKRDAGIPMSEQPFDIQYEPMREASFEGGHIIKDANNNIVMTREYYFRNNSGETVIIQDHGFGHIKGGQGSHFNVRPEYNTRTGHINSTLDHYPFN